MNSLPNPTTPTADQSANDLQYILSQLAIFYPAHKLSTNKPTTITLLAVLADDDTWSICVHPDVFAHGTQPTVPKQMDLTPLSKAWRLFFLNRPLIPHLIFDFCQPQSGPPYEFLCKDINKSLPLAEMWNGISFQQVTTMVLTIATENVMRFRKMDQERKDGVKLRFEVVLGDGGVEGEGLVWLRKWLGKLEGWGNL